MTNNRDSIGASHRFAYVLGRFSRILPDHEEQFLRWTSVIKPEEIKNMSVVDAGCGNGRNSFWLAKYGAKTILAFDIEKQTTKIAAQNLVEIPQCQVIQSSIYDFTPFVGKEKQYDYVFCIGVIQHLSEPVEALKNLTNFVKPGGRLVMWVYGKEGNEKLLRLLDRVRYFTSKMPLPIVRFLSDLCGAFTYILIKVGQPRNPYLVTAKSWSFRHLASVIFDQLVPPIANYWTRQEVIELAESSGWEPMRVEPVNGMSWSLLAEVKHIST